MKKIALIMAGGFGARLWPRSKEDKPKQFMHFLGEGTMLQNTVMRLMPLFSIEDIYIIANESLYHLIREQIPSLPEENILLEPFGRNTAPCIALSSVYLSKKYDEETVLAVFPSDHSIQNVRDFQHSIETSCQAAYDLHGFVTIGILPTRPETGYGYIQIDENPEGLGDLYKQDVRKTKTFAEKPDRETALRFIETGEFLWNSGMLISRFDNLWQSLEKYSQESYYLWNALRQNIDKENFKEKVIQTYMQVPSISVDYTLLEKADNVYVIKSDFNWSDVGTWDELYRLSMKDARNNVIEGDVIAVKTSNCLINSSNRLIGIAGVDNLIVIDTDDSLLICRRGSSTDVKEIIDYMRRKNITKFL